MFLCLSVDAVFGDVYTFQPNFVLTVSPQHFTSRLFTVPWSSRRDRGRAALSRVKTVASPAKARCSGCRTNTSTSSALSAKVTRQSRHHSIHLYTVIVWQFSFRQLYNSLYPKGILKGALNEQLLEPEHKTNVMKTSRYFVVPHYTVFTLTNSIILHEWGGWGAYCCDSGLPQP